MVQLVIWCWGAPFSDEYETILIYGDVGTFEHWFFGDSVFTPGEEPC